MAIKERKELSPKKKARVDRRRKQNLQRLSEKLVARHLRISVPDKTVRDILAEHHRKSVYPDKMVECQMRCIAIVGAGASAPVLARGMELAENLEVKFGRDEVELERLRLVNNLKRTHFETRLIALSRTPEAERLVRETIAEQYSINYPPLLANELLAHLLKHRFLDAIVSFNFDELLDQSIDDELGPGEYVQVVSERDCAKIQSDPDEPDYIPLYVKLHGTASEPESLRFTPDSYYAIPERVSDVVANLMHAEHCVLLNVGTGLTSFDFQRLMTIPTRLEVFNLSLRPLEGRIRKKISERRKRAKKEHPRGYEAARPAKFHESATYAHDCDAHLRGLVKSIRRVAQAPRKGASAPEPLVQLRSVRRHEAVVRLLGGDRGGGIAGHKTWSSKAQAEYLERRTILELALAGSKARGLLSLGPLSQDRPARYFDQYKQQVRKGGVRWGDLCSAAGLEECEELPDVLVSRPTFRKEGSKSGKASESKRGGSTRIVRERSDTQRLHEVKSRKLARHVLARIARHPSQTDMAMLAAAIRGMQKESEIELHTQDDRVCSKAFQHPATLKTVTSLQIYTWLMFRDLKKSDRIYICSETGAWLARNSIPRLLEKPRKMKALHAFDIEKRELRKHYSKKRLQLEFVNPWHHNRHMTIVCHGKEPIRAIYFARHLRNPVITAVYLNDIADVQRMRLVHEIRWKEAREARRRRSGS